MKETPIIFSTPMVKAILEGRKTMTRRIVKPQPFKDERGWWHSYPFYHKNINPGDLLWVRERFETETDGNVKYYAGNIEVENNKAYERLTKWKPSIHMPKAAARIWLKVKDVRVERLEDISAKDAIAEGIDYMIDKITGFCGYDYLSGGYNLMTTPISSFLSLWRFVHIMERYEPTGNPLVWVIEFEVISTTGKP